MVSYSASGSWPSLSTWLLIVSLPTGVIFPPRQKFNGESNVCSTKFRVSNQKGPPHSWLLIWSARSRELSSLLTLILIGSSPNKQMFGLSEQTLPLRDREIKATGRLVLPRRERRPSPFSWPPASLQASSNLRGKMPTIRRRNYFVAGFYLGFGVWEGRGGGILAKSSALQNTIL